MSDEQINRLGTYYSTHTSPSSISNFPNSSGDINYDIFGHPDFKNSISGQQYCVKSEALVGELSDLGPNDLIPDFDLANKKLISDGYEIQPLHPSGSLIIIKINGVRSEKLTWHHHEDGKTLMPVWQTIHNAPTSRHTGGQSIMKNTLKGFLIQHFKHIDIMYKSGFNILYDKQNNGSTSIDVESKHNIILPNEYKLFYDSFKTGKDSLKNDFILRDENFLLPLYDFFYGKIEDKTYISIYDFVNIYETFSIDSFEIPQDPLVCIAYTNDVGGGGVYMSLNEKSFGYLYKVKWEYVNDNDAEYPIFLSKNIFEFIQNVRAILMYDSINFSQVYRNWGEDFWRVREE